MSLLSGLFGGVSAAPPPSDILIDVDFEGIVTADLASIFTTVGGFTTVQSLTVKNGSNALRSQAGKALQYTNPNGIKTQGIIGGWWYYAGQTSFLLAFQNNSGGIQCGVYSNGNGTVSFRQNFLTTTATSGAILTSGNWYYVECKVDFDTDQYEVRVDGVNVASGTATLDSGAAGYYQFMWGSSPDGGTYYFDDVRAGQDTADFLMSASASRYQIRWRWTKFIRNFFAPRRMARS